MQRPSNQETDAITWTTAALPIGASGLDLRLPTGPSLTRLQNARFRDERSLERRSGHTGITLQDSSGFGSGGTPADWIFGHGREVTPGGTYPIPGVARGTFRLDGTDVAWTGDRLLVVRENEPCIGEHAFWGRGNGVQKQGIPAYLPVQTDSSTPDVVGGEYVETCLTETVRVVLATGAGVDLLAWVVDRTTGAVLNKTTLVDDAAAIYDPRVVNSAGIPVALWLNGTTLTISWWSGTAWSTPSTIASSCDAFEVEQSTTGFFLLWRDSGTLKIGRYEGYSIANSTPVFGKDLGLTTTGALAFSVNPDGGDIAVVYQPMDNTLRAAVFDDQGDNGVNEELDTEHVWDAGLTCCWRALTTTFVVYAGTAVYTRIFEVANDASIAQEETRYRTQVASKAFRVGDEVLCWLRAQNSESNYLVAGVSGCQVVGVCDREEAKERAVNNDVRALPIVSVDPLDSYAFTWARPITTSRSVTIDDATTVWDETYSRAGNARLGDLQFLPSLSAVQYGSSVYLAGSLVRNWDGVELGDAGFHDYPTVEDIDPVGPGSLTVSKLYQWRVYPVRYNKRGERFQGSAITASVTLGGAEQGADLTINTLPLTNHDDVVFEVYRTEGNGTTFYLEGTVDNDLTSPTVAFSSTMADSTLLTKQGDPHATGVGQISEVEEMGPIGCQHLAVAGDRLWGWGGQVPRGVVQFSKLKEPREAAGFDILDSTQEVDSEGGEITSLVGYNDGIVIFERDRLYVMFGAGPNNYGLGAFSTPQIVLADGATTHLGTAVTQVGVVYWGVDGPRLLGPAFKVEPICLPVRPLSSTLEPTGVRVNLARQEVVWYTDGGTALLWNYLAGSRWAQWTGLNIAGCSPHALVTTEGVLLQPDDEVHHDAGVPYAFTVALSNLRPEEILQGHTQVRRVGISGQHLGDHEVRFRVYYDNSPTWSEEFTWEPQTETWLVSAEELATMTPTQIDALVWNDRSGSYDTHKRLKRQTCNFFRVEFTDVSASNPTFTPFELTCELGRKPGMGRTAINTFRD